ncbi:hypothetical protein HMPREF6745_0182 [Prevotella sp. oral taxon 472 str. F0295]|nr:hypothetical protein HMPREF6745_0182 [Prevotella sp. oral taxon 472 str. F0295]
MINFYTDKLATHAKSIRLKTQHVHKQMIINLLTNYSLSPNHLKAMI